MKKILILKISILLGICTYSQKNADLLFLKTELLKRNYLFHSFKKEAFIRLLQNYDADKPLTNYKTDKLLAHFKEINLYCMTKDDSASFKVKSINGKLYLITIDKEYNYLLEERILKINHISINDFKEKLKETFYLPHQKNIESFLDRKLSNISFLREAGLLKNVDSIYITTTNYIGNIPLKSKNTASIKLEKKLFKDRKNNAWFWIYGINYGQQVFLKFNKLLSASHLKKIKDSLKWSNYKYAKTFKISIQETYNPLKFTDMVNKLHLKFSNKRYKKLIIDFRDTYIGTDYNLNYFINHLKKIKRLKGKHKIYILLNKNTKGASLKYINKLQKTFKPILIGETVYNTTSNSNDYDYMELPVSKIKIQIPKKHQKPIEIFPNIKVTQTVQQSIKGIDAALSKSTEE